jgi:hypothetical protein
VNTTVKIHEALLAAWCALGLIRIVSAAIFGKLIYVIYVMYDFGRRVSFIEESHASPAIVIRESPHSFALYSMRDCVRCKPWQKCLCCCSLLSTFIIFKKIGTSINLINYKLGIMVTE